MNVKNPRRKPMKPNKKAGTSVTPYFMGNRSPVPSPNGPRVRLGRIFNRDKIKSVGTSILNGVFVSAVLILIFFTVILYPLNKAKPYMDQSVLSTETYLTNLSNSVEYFGGGTYLVSWSPTTSQLISYGDITLPSPFDEKINSLNIVGHEKYYDGSAVFHFSVGNTIYKSYPEWTELEGGTRHVSYYVTIDPMYIEDDQAPNFSSLLYLYDLYEQDEVDIWNLIGEHLVFLGDSISYGLSTFGRIMPFNSVKPRRDFGVTIPWRC